MINLHLVFITSSTSSLHLDLGNQLLMAVQILQGLHLAAKTRAKILEVYLPCSSRAYHTIRLQQCFSYAIKFSDSARKCILQGVLQVCVNISKYAKLKQDLQALMLVNPDKIIWLFSLLSESKLQTPLRSYFSFKHSNARAFSSTSSFPVASSLPFEKSSNSIPCLIVHFPPEQVTGNEYITSCNQAKSCSRDDFPDHFDQDIASSGRPDRKRVDQIISYY